MYNHWIIGPILNENEYLKFHFDIMYGLANPVLSIYPMNVNVEEHIINVYL